MPAVKRPERVRAFGKRVSYQYVVGDPLSDGLVGECDPDNQRILIREGQPLESEQDTVLHELTHYIDEAMDIGLKETQVKKLATAWLAVLKDNPRLAAYLRRKK